METPTTPACSTEASLNGPDVSVTLEQIEAAAREFAKARADNDESREDLAFASFIAGCMLMSGIVRSMHQGAALVPEDK